MLPTCVRASLTAAVALLLFAGLPGPAVARASAGCAGDSTYATLDFWVGEWRVFVGDTQVGTNRISKVLRGYALVEEWQDARGGRGQSLFYVDPALVDPALRQWKQVWVTETAHRVGGVKEKHLLVRLPDGGVRFQGELRQPDGSLVLDRTTLSPLPGKEVRQPIEVSADGGTTWRPAFDAVYRPAP